MTKFNEIILLDDSEPKYVTPELLRSLADSIEATEAGKVIGTLLVRDDSYETYLAFPLRVEG